MKNKWHASQVRIAQKWLTDTWPELFRPGRDLKPLSLKVHKEILQHATRPAGVSRRAVTEALKRHTRSFGYLFGLSKNTHRFDLDLQLAELISDQHKEWARRTLRRQQKISQAAKRKAFAERKLAPSPLRMSPARRKPDTQITYKKARRRLILKPAPAQATSAANVAA